MNEAHKNADVLDTGLHVHTKHATNLRFLPETEVILPILGPPPHLTTGAR